MVAQLSEIRSGAKDTQELLQAAKTQASNTGILAQATKEAVEAARVQAKAAGQSADAAKGAIEIAQANIKLEQRAWIGIVRELNQISVWVTDHLWGSLSLIPAKRRA